MSGDHVDTFRKALRADLGFHGADTRHSNHGWHPFPAKFPPQLPQFFIERLSKTGDVVLDPMFGSGTTILEAARLKRHAIGCDIDPLARMIAAAKLAPLDGVGALRKGLSITDTARRSLFEERGRLERCLQARFDDKTRAFVDYWFLPQQQLELTALLEQIESLPQKDEPEAGGQSDPRTFFEMVLSSTIIAKSGGVSLARDLAHTRPHRAMDKQPNSAFDEFTKRLKIALASGPDGRTPNRSVDIRAASADATGLSAGSVDLIVTSPPYANNAIDYMRAHKFSLVWFGWKISDLTRIRGQYLGHDASTTADFSGLPDRCEKTIAKLGCIDQRKANALRRYFGEMSAVIAEMLRVLKMGKAAVIVVGSSVLRGIDVQTHQGLAAIGEQAGFELVDIGSRRLDRDKRMMPARWGNEKRSSIEQRMHEEYVIGLIKP